MCSLFGLVTKDGIVSSRLANLAFGLSAKGIVFTLKVDQCSVNGTIPLPRAGSCDSCRHHEPTDAPTFGRIFPYSWWSCGVGSSPILYGQPFLSSGITLWLNSLARRARIP